MAREAPTVVKKVKNAELYSDGTIRIHRARLSYPHFGEPNVNENEDGTEKKTWGTVAMLSKETHSAAIKLLKGVIDDMLAELGVKVPKENRFLRFGTKLADEDDKKELYRDHYIVTANEYRRIPVYDSRGRQMVDASIEDIDEMFYGGMWATIIIRPWYFNGKTKKSKKTFPKRILAGCVAVQFVEHDEPFGEGRIDATGRFDNLLGDDDDTDGMEDDDDDD